MVVAAGTFLPAERIVHGIVRGRDAVDNSFVEKSLQCPVNGHPVKFFTRLFFNVGVRECPWIAEENTENLFAAIGYAQLISFQNVVTIGNHRAFKKLSRISWGWC